MGNKRLLTENQKKHLNVIYLNYLEQCEDDEVLPSWNGFHTFLYSQDKNITKLDEKQLNNKIIDFRKIHGIEQWPTFKSFKESRKNQLFKHLFRRSKNSFFLALEIYNRITQENRIEAFCILIVNAYELLFKGKIIRDFGEEKIYFDIKSGKTISIKKSLDFIFPDKNDIRFKNIVKIIEIRDNATHLVIPELQRTLSRLFQSTVFNFINIYENITNNKLDIAKQSGFLSLIVDEDKFSDQLIEKKYGRKSHEVVKKFLKSVKKEEDEFKSNEYAIPIEYKLVLTNKEEDADITLTKSKSNISSKNPGLIVQVPKDPDRTHPFISKDAIKSINIELEGKGHMTINQYAFTAIVYKEGIRKDKANQYYFRFEKPETHRYSQEFIDLIVKKLTENENYLESCTAKYKEHLQDMKTKNME